MVTFTIHIPQMLAYIPAPWILWVLQIGNEWWIRGKNAACDGIISIDYHRDQFTDEVEGHGLRFSHNQHVGLQKFEFKQQERGFKIKHSLQMFLYNGPDPFRKWVLTFLIFISYRNGCGQPIHSDFPDFFGVDRVDLGALVWSNSISSNLLAKAGMAEGC